MGRLGRQRVKCRQPAPPGHSGVRVRARFGADYTGRVRLDSATVPPVCQTSCKDANRDSRFMNRHEAKRAKRARRRRERSSQRRRSQPPRPAKRSRRWRTTLRQLPARVLSVVGKSWKAILAIVGTASAVASLAAFLLPRLTVAPMDIVRTQMLSVPFTVTNTGWISIRSVDLGCYIETAQIGGLTFDRVLSAPLPGREIRVIEPDGGATAECNFQLESKRAEDLTHADIQVFVSFNVFGWRLSRQFRFIAMRTNDGQLRWTRQPFTE